MKDNFGSNNLTGLRLALGRNCMNILLEVENEMHQQEMSRTLPSVIQKRRWEEKLQSLHRELSYRLRQLEEWGIKSQ